MKRQWTLIFWLLLFITQHSASQAWVKKGAADRFYAGNGSYDAGKKNSALSTGMREFTGPANGNSQSIVPTVSFDPISVSTWVGDSVHGFVDGIGKAARFHTINHLCSDKDGNVYVVDNRNECIRKITPDALVTTFAGNGHAGYVDGAGTSAMFNFPNTIALDSAGCVYVGERGNNALRKITPGGVVTTLVGSNGWLGRHPNFNGLVVDKTGNIFVSDGDQNTILKVTPQGVVSVYAGNGSFTETDGPRTIASFINPGAMAFDQEGALYVVDMGSLLYNAGGELRKIATDGMVSTIHLPAFPVNLSAAKSGLTIDQSDNIYLSVDNLVTYQDFGIYKITPSRSIALLAGTGTGHVDSTGSDAKFFGVNNLTMDDQGNIYAGETAQDFGVEFGHWLRKLSKPKLQLTASEGLPSATRYFTISANNAYDAVNINGPDAYEISTNEAGPWVPASMSVGTNPGGELNVMKIFIRLKAGIPAGEYNDSLTLSAIGAVTQKLGIRAVVISAVNPVPAVSFDPIAVSTWVGDSVHGFVDGIGRSARLHTPTSLVSDKAGNVYVVDNRNECIRKITPGAVVSTLAGNGQKGFADGTGTAARFNFPVYIGMDSAGFLYVGERGNNALRKITPGGVVSTLVGPDGWLGRHPNFNGLAVDKAGNIFVADGDQNTILAVTPQGVVSVYAGNGLFAETDGPRNTASFKNPATLAFDHAGNLLVVDAGLIVLNTGGELRKISPDGMVSTIHLPGLPADLSAARIGLSIDRSDNIFLGINDDMTYKDFGVYKITPSLNIALLAGSGAGHIDSIGSDARLFGAANIAMDGQGNLYMQEIAQDFGAEFGHWIRKFSKPVLQLNTNAGRPSATRYFTISANNAYDAVNINGPDIYEIAINETGPWFPASMSIGTNAGGELNVMKIFIRVKASAAAGVYNDSLTLSATGAVTQRLGIASLVRDTTAPVITCLPRQTFCHHSSGLYNLPSLVATDPSYIREISYTITGATSRKGSGANASGLFNPGNSVITWSVTDWWSNTASCQTPVSIGMPFAATIPNVYPLLGWAPANTLYIGFGPSSVVLTALATGGTALPGTKYNYLWSDGSTGKSVTVSPHAAGNYTYTVTVTDSLGCKVTATKSISVIDIRCGQKLNKVLVCWPNQHGNTEACINENQVWLALLLGAKPGGCGNNALRTMKMPESGSVKGTSIFPNPNNGTFVLQLTSLANTEIRIVDQNGRIILRKLVTGKAATQQIDINLGRVANGLYAVQAITKDGITTAKLVVQQ